MRKEIIDALKAKFEGVSDNVLSRIADKLAKTATNAEQVATAVEGVTFQQVIDSYGDSRATEAQQTAVRNYESKYGLKDGEKVEKGGTTPPPDSDSNSTPKGGNDETPAWAKTLLEANKAMSERIAQMEGARTTENRRMQLNGIIGKLPENLRKAYERTPVENLSDEEFTTLTSEINTEVEGIVKETKQRGAIFGKPTANVGNNKSEQLTKEQEETIAHRDVIAQQGSQPF